MKTVTQSLVFSFFNPSVLGLSVLHISIYVVTNPFISREAAIGTSAIFMLRLLFALKVIQTLQSQISGRIQVSVSPVSLFTEKLGAALPDL